MATKRPNLWLVIALCCCAGAAFAMAFVMARKGSSVSKGTPAPEPLPAIPIAQAKQTILVPTLDTPVSGGQSTVWCASFQLAWDRLKADVTRGPVQLRNAEVVAERLNRARVSEADLRAEDYFAVAGTASEGIAATIEREMAKRFPDAARPEIGLPVDAVAAFAFLAAQIPWKYEFHENREPLEFTDAEGRRTSVRSFGILESDHCRDAEAKFFRGQVALLWEAKGTGRTPEEFVVDLCRDSAPYQVVLARVKRKATLADTLNDVQLKIQHEPASNDRLGDEDELLVPTMHWQVEHHFKELEGPDKVLLNGPIPGSYLAVAVQGVQFRLDQRGAEVASGALIVFLDGGPRRFHFDRPFLLYVKKRDAKQPILVMWVENSGVLQPF